MSRIIILNYDNRNMTKIRALKPLTKEPLAELFLSMAMKDDNPQEADKAFSEFYSQYKDFLYTVIKNVCRSWKMYGDELIETVFNNTFLAVYFKAEQFIVIEDIPLDRQDKRIKAWLGQIAKNEMLQLLRDLKVEKDKIDYTDDFSFVKYEDSDSENYESENYLLAEKALNTLSERDRNILVTYLMFQDGNKKLPSNEIDRLADMWSVHPDNMRQIKKRSLKKVEEYIKNFKKK